MFDTEGYGLIDIEEIKELLCNVDETLTCAEQDEILAKVGKIDEGKINYGRKSRFQHNNKNALKFLIPAKFH